jgi:replicative superfamily II helicase
MSEFVVLKKSDMDDFIAREAHEEKGFTCSRVSGAAEWVYDIPHGLGFRIRVYSSIVGDDSRGKGKDACRVVLFDNVAERVLGKTKRVHRTEGATSVYQRLKQRIDELKDFADKLEFCHECGSVMATRNGRFGEFYSCIAYPDCSASRDLDAPAKGAAGERKRRALLERETSALEDAGAGASPVSAFDEAGGVDEAPEPRNIREPVTKPRRPIKRAAVPHKPQVDVQRGELAYTPEQFMDILDRASEAETGPVVGEVPLEFKPTEEFELIQYEFETFQPIQSALADQIHKDANIICVAPTGAGKTVLAEMAIAKAISEGRKAIYLSPFKALTQEKYDDWTNGIFADYNISIVTGDYTLTKERVQELRDAHIILLTTEMLDSRTRRMEAEKNDWLLQVGVVVPDEIHIIGMAGRGDRCEAGLMRFLKVNPECRIVGISATMPNVEELAKWAEVLNRKQTILLKSSWRPVTLNVHAIAYSGRFYREQEASKLENAMALVQMFPQDKFLVFVHAKTSGRMLLKALQEANIPSDFHSADLALDKRLEIEASFKNRENGIRVLVSTSTTAWGVNMPARRCIIFGVTRGLAPVDILDIIQEIGRSGRPGLDPEGDAYILCPHGDELFWEDIVANCPPIRSQMLKKEVLGFHLCAEIGRKPMRVDEMKVWYRRSLAATQGTELPDELLEETLNSLVEIGCVQWNPHWLNYELTQLGRVSAWLYYDPWSVAAWATNFTWLFENNLDRDSEAVAVALTNIPAYEMDYVVREFGDKVARLAMRFATQLNFREGTGVMALAVDAMLIDGEVPNGLAVFYRQISFDIDRIGQALRLIDSRARKWERAAFFETLTLRVRYGVPEELVELVKLPGVGGARARKLAQAGIKSLNDFLGKSQVAKNVLGKIYPKALAKANELTRAS